MIAAVGRLLTMGAAVAVLLPFAVAFALADSSPEATEMFRFDDPEVIESSGLVALGSQFVTVNDSGDRGRVFVIGGRGDRAGETVGVTSWATTPVDVEALAPGASSTVWVADIGDNFARRDGVRLYEVAVGTGDRTVEPATYDVVYPNGAQDAESLLRHPDTGQLFIVNKTFAGGTVFAVPRRLDSEAPNRARIRGRAGAVLAFATDAAFFPDARHIIVRSYGRAGVYTWPALEEVGRFDLPDQEQGEGLAVDDRGRIFLSSEGLRAPVLRVALPASIVDAMAPAEPHTPPPGPSTSQQDRDQGEGAADPDDRGALPGPLGLWVAIGLGVVMSLFATLLVRSRRRS